MFRRIIIPRSGAPQTVLIRTEALQGSWTGPVTEQQRVHSDLLAVCVCERERAGKESAESAMLELRWTPHLAAGQVLMGI